MKYLILVLLTFIALSSCQNNNTVSSKRASPKNSDHSEIQGLSVIRGSWVKSEYIDELVKTRSPIKSSSAIKGFSALIIDEKLISGDSLRVGVSLSNHEGSNFNIFLSSGQTSASYKTDIVDYDNQSSSYELSYEIINSDTTLILSHYNTNRDLIDKTKYRKVLESYTSNDMAYGIQYIVNKIVISGSYKEIDLSGPTHLIQFNPEGSVSGLGGFKSYFILTDFDLITDTSPDVICFNMYGENEVYYAFELSGNSIQFFETTSDEEQQLQKGRLVYTLTKK